MVFQRVRAPVGLAGPDEVLEEELEHVIPRDGVRGRSLEPVIALRAWREGNVADEREHLDRRQTEGQDHCREREPQAPEPARRRVLTGLLQREV